MLKTSLLKAKQRKHQLNQEHKKEIHLKNWKNVQFLTKLILEPQEARPKDLNHKVLGQLEEPEAKLLHHHQVEELQHKDQLHLLKEEVNHQVAEKFLLRDREAK